MSAPVTYPPDVERWRPLVAKYFRAADVNKALWVIQYESGGQPDAKGDFDGQRGIYAARGLFQIQSSANFPDRPAAEWLDVPENNIAYAARMVGDGSGWSHWGENNLYQGKVFGALGNHPYPGDPVGQPSPPAPDTALSARVGALEAAMGGATAIAVWNGRGNSLLLGYSIEQQRLAALTAQVEQLAKTPSVGGIDRGAIVTALEQLSAQQRREADTIDALIKALSPGPGGNG